MSPSTELDSFHQQHPSVFFFLCVTWYRRRRRQIRSCGPPPLVQSAFSFHRRVRCASPHVKRKKKEIFTSPSPSSSLLQVYSTCSHLCSCQGTPPSSSSSHSSSAHVHSTKYMKSTSLPPLLLLLLLLDSAKFFLLGHHVAVGGRERDKRNVVGGVWGANWNNSVYGQ